MGYETGPAFERDLEAGLALLPDLNLTLREFASPMLEQVERVTLRDVAQAMHLVLPAWNSLANPGEEEWARTVRRTCEEKCAPEVHEMAPGWIAELLELLRLRRFTVFPDDPRVLEQTRVRQLPDGELVLEYELGATDLLVRAYRAGDLHRRLAPLHGSLREVVLEHRFDPRWLHVELPVPHPGAGAFDRHEVRLAWRHLRGSWRAPPLAELLRGDGAGPSLRQIEARMRSGDLDAVTRALMQAMCAMTCWPDDTAYEESCDALEALQADPDGPGTGRVFDAFWQHLALALAAEELSPAEFHTWLVVADARFRDAGEDPGPWED